MKGRFIKEGALLAPFDSQTELWFNAQQAGKYFEVEIKHPRNYEFHKKYFALLDSTFPHWNPPLVPSKWGIPEKSFEQYREDLTILTGYYNLVPRLDGTPRPVAKSISFAKMSNDDFSLLYSKTIDAIIKYVLVGWTIEQVDKLAGSFL